jgi:hypothetical protein
MDHLYRRITGPIKWDMIEEEVAKVQHAPGNYITVNLDQLISVVYVSPTSQSWFLEVVHIETLGLFLQARIFLTFRPIHFAFNRAENAICLIFLSEATQILV